MKKIVVGLAPDVFGRRIRRRSTTTPEITPPGNGEEWLKLSSTEKLFWSIGYAQGYQRGARQDRRHVRSELAVRESRGAHRAAVVDVREAQRLRAGLRARALLLRSCELGHPGRQRHPHLSSAGQRQGSDDDSGADRHRPSSSACRPPRVRALSKHRHIVVPRSALHSPGHHREGRVRVKSILVVLLIAVAGTTATPVTGQEEPLPAIVVKQSVFLAVEPVHGTAQPSLADAVRANDYPSFDALYREAVQRGESVARTRRCTRSGPTASPIRSARSTVRTCTRVSRARIPSSRSYIDEYPHHG
jgi:hypothetical protein